MKKPTKEDKASTSQSILPNQNRRNFLKSMAIAAGGLAFAPVRIMAGPFTGEELRNLVPVDKKLHPEWIKSLYERGTPTIYKGEELKYIGMPVGGIFTGQLYLGGDGKLWRWDIFNRHGKTGGYHYANPPKPEYPLEQGFEIQIGDDIHSLDNEGFSEVSFKGQYPIGEVNYKDTAIPVEVKLEAYSPFIPLNSDDSGIPATIMQFTVKNTSTLAVDLNLNGKLENAICIYNRHLNGSRNNKLIKESDYSFLSCTATKEESNEEPRPEITYEDWDKTNYQGWQVEGDAFGTGPIKKSDMPSYQGNVGGDTKRVVNSHATAPGVTVGDKDNATGKLISSEFVINRKFINLWIGGGDHKAKTCVNLIVDDETILYLTGKNSNQMQLQSMHVQNLQGKKAHLEIVDAQQGAWANIGVGKITFSDVEAEGMAFDQLGDYGTMGLALLGNEPASITENCDANSTLTETLIGKLGRDINLKPGQSKTISFVVCWNFPNVKNGSIGSGRYYANKFKSASEIAHYVATNFQQLSSQTQLWRDTWYDSTLPYWFLDRTFLNISTAATNTCYRYQNGRMWAWEGVGCCVGTCTHVWHYAQALARIFPDIERDVRARVDLGVALNQETGVSGFRAENDQSFAVDGQAGTILRILREHQMTTNNDFLAKNWEEIKSMFKPFFKLDPQLDGILEGGQMNTLDRPWYGKVAWLSSIYLAAVRAGEVMATELGDTDFANKCKSIIEKGLLNIDKELFNGEYYYQVAQSGNSNQVGSYDGCQIDQVLGQSWAFQVGLDRVLSEENTKKALESLWKYNFAIDAGGYRKSLNAGRVFAMEGEAGLLMCSWPKGDSKRVKVSYDYYFNECMTGFEYQVAGHMIWEGMLEKGLAITKAVHDRYHASKRNPWNEVECGDHYARAMASYGIHIAASGYIYDGPNEKIGFAPKLKPENFKTAFTAAEGWGTYTQVRTDTKQISNIDIKYGELKVKTLSLELPVNIKPESVEVKLLLNGISSSQEYQIEGQKIQITTPSLTINKNNTLQAKVSFKLNSSTDQLEANNNELIIYPNPSSGKIKFEFKKSPITLTITDLNGITSLKKEIHNKIFEHNVSGMNKGTYVATANYEGALVSKKMLII